MISSWIKRGPSRQTAQRAELRLSNCFAKGNRREISTVAWRFRKNLHTVFTRDSLRDRSLFTGPQRLNINGRHVFHRDRSSASCKIIKLANEIQLKTAALRNRETITIEPVRLRYNWINERSGPCDSTVSLYEFTITTRQEKRSLAGFTIDRSKISNVCRCSSISKVVRNSQCRGISYAKHGGKLAYLLLWNAQQKYPVQGVSMKTLFTGEKACRVVKLGTSPILNISQKWKIRCKVTRIPTTTRFVYRIQENKYLPEEVRTKLEI